MLEVAGRCPFARHLVWLGPQTTVVCWKGTPAELFAFGSLLLGSDLFACSPVELFSVLEPELPPEEPFLLGLDESTKSIPDVQSGQNHDPSNETIVDDEA